MFEFLNGQIVVAFGCLSALSKWCAEQRPSASTCATYQDLKVDHLLKFFVFSRTCPGGLIEGIADWVRLRAGLGAKHWKQEADGKWDAGYQHTGYFLE